MRGAPVRCAHAGAAGLSHFAGAFMGMQLLMGREVLFECREGRPRAPTRHFYWLSSSSSKLYELYGPLVVWEVHLLSSSFSAHKQSMDPILQQSAGVAHTKDQKVALGKLMKSKSQPIYIVDNCPAGKPAASCRLYR